jgi:hypothetical protein
MADLIIVVVAVVFAVCPHAPLTAANKRNVESFIG